MVAKLTVIFFIVLFLLAGVSLTLMPWMSVGLIGDWSNNFFLALAVEKTGWNSLREIVASNWFRGAVTGFGVLNLLLAFWEMAHFKQNVEMIIENDKQTNTSTKKPLNSNNI